VLATRGPAAQIDLVPVTFALVGDTVVSAVDHKPKSTRRLQRLIDIERDPTVALLADHYEDRDWDRLWWVRAHGQAEVVERAEPRLLEALAGRYPQYAERRPEGPFVVVAVDRWVGWAAETGTGSTGRRR
jgi:PPOX class probable F420-dependent enzyme